MHLATHCLPTCERGNGLVGCFRTNHGIRCMYVCTCTSQIECTALMSYLSARILSSLFIEPASVLGGRQGSHRTCMAKVARREQKSGLSCPHPCCTSVLLAELFWPCVFWSFDTTLDMVPAHIDTAARAGTATTTSPQYYCCM